MQVECAKVAPGVVLVVCLSGASKKKFLLQLNHLMETSFYTKTANTHLQEINLFMSGRLA